MTTATVQAPAVEVGSFFECSWGYDQTNVDFYKVVDISPSGKTIKVQQWSSSGDAAGRVVPGEGPRTSPRWADGCRDGEVEAPVLTRRLASWSGDRAAFTVNSYSAAYQWNGRPAYETPVGAGH